MSTLIRQTALVLALSFAIAACAQPPATPAPKPASAPAITANPAADTAASTPNEEAAAMSQATPAEPERGPAIPAAELRKRIIDLIGSLRSLKDLERENVEKVLRMPLQRNPRMAEGYEYEGVTSEGWRFGVSVDKLNRLEEPSTIRIGMDYDFDYDKRQPQNYCTLAFEPVADEFVAMGYERGQRARYAGGDYVWGFGREYRENKASFGIGVSIYELALANGTKQICVRSFDIGGGTFNG